MCKNNIILYFVSIAIAASVLGGCGSNASKDNLQDGAIITDVPSIPVIGPDEQVGDDVNETADARTPLEEVAALDVTSIVDEPSWTAELKGGARAEGKRILCWGDSLTEGTGGGDMTYPARLEELTGMEVLNYGVFSEKAGLIAARQGGNPVHVCEVDEIPAATERVKVTIENDSNGNMEMWLVFGEAGINPCEIAGVKGTLEIDSSDGSRFFTRLEAGEAVPITNENAKLTTYAMQDKRPGDILVIWSGSTDGWDEDRSLDAIIEYQKSMIKYANCDEYIIINYTAKPNIGEEIDAWNARLKKEYGEHLVDVRGYLMKYGLEDAGITPSQQDNTDIAQGQIPESLRVDESHGTGDFYRIIGDLVYKKMIELGYIE